MNSNAPPSRRRQGLCRLPLLLVGTGLLGASSSTSLDLLGFVRMGWSHGIALAIALLLQSLFALVLGDLAMRHRRRGLLSDFARQVCPSAAWRGLGLALGLLWLAVVLIAAVGEARHGARLVAVFGVGTGRSWLDVLLLLAVVLGIAMLGMRAALRILVGLALASLLLRIGVGSYALLGFAETGPWRAAHLDLGAWADRGLLDLVPVALPLALWSLVGLELLLPLAGAPVAQRSRLPWMLVLVVGVSFAVGTLFAIGVVGTLPCGTWKELVLGPLHTSDSEALLVVGQQLLGDAWAPVVGLLGLLCCLSTLSAALLSVTRVLGPMLEGSTAPTWLRSHYLRSTRHGPRRGATALTALLIALPAALPVNAAGLLQTAIYAWIPLQVVFFGLSLRSRRLHPHLPRTVPGPVWTPLLLCGAAALLLVHRIAFEHRHTIELPRVAFLVVLSILAAAWLQRPRPVSGRTASRRSCPREDESEGDESRCVRPLLQRRPHR